MTSTQPSAVDLYGVLWLREICDRAGKGCLPDNIDARCVRRTTDGLVDALTAATARADEAEARCAFKDQTNASLQACIEGERALKAERDQLTEQLSIRTQQWAGVLEALKEVDRIAGKEEVGAATDYHAAIDVIRVVCDRSLRLWSSPDAALDRVKNARTPPGMELACSKCGNIRFGRPSGRDLWEYCCTMNCPIRAAKEADNG